MRIVISAHGTSVAVEVLRISEMKSMNGPGDGVKRPMSTKVGTESPDAKFSDDGPAGAWPGVLDNALKCFGIAPEDTRSGSPKNKSMRAFRTGPRVRDAESPSKRRARAATSAVKDI